MKADPTPAAFNNDLVVQLVRLVGSNRPRRLLIAASAPGELAPVVARVLKSRSTDLLALGPQPANPGAGAGDDFKELGQNSEAYDLILAIGALEVGGLAVSAARVRALAELLGPDGRAGFLISTFAAMPREEPAGPLDAVLFAEAAAAGDLGETIGGRTSLPPSSWRLLLGCCGLSIEASTSARRTRLPPALLDSHAERLAHIDRNELEAEYLLVAARRAPEVGS